MNGAHRQPPKVEMSSDRASREAIFRGRSLSDAIAEMVSIYFHVTVEGQPLQDMTDTVRTYLAGATGERAGVA